MESQTHFESSENQIEEKRRIWDEKMAQMLKPDNYGYIIDEKIRETIIALNLLGINTTQSDQGNNSDSPWIQFEAPEPENYYEGEDELRAEVLKQKNLPSEVMDQNSLQFDRSVQVDIWAASRDELMRRGAKYTPEFLEYLEKTQNMVEKMQSLIDEYYVNPANIKNREIKVQISYPYNDPKYAPYLHRIPFLEVSIPNQRRSEDGQAILAETQAEMLRFTEFLKDKFFKGK